MEKCESRVVCGICKLRGKVGCWTFPLNVFSTACLCGELYRCQVLRATMRSLFVVLAAPQSNLLSGVEQVVEPAYSQALLSQSSMEAFHARVLRRLAGLDVHQVDRPFNRPGQELSTGQFRSVVTGIDPGCPRCSMIWSNARVTRWLAKLVSTSSARHSRLWASTTLNTWIDRPAAIAS